MGRFGGRVAALLARALLWTYPPSFRREMGLQIEEDVRCRAGGFEGVFGLLKQVGWLFRLSLSLVVNAVGAWREDRAAVSARHAGDKGRAFSWLDVKLGLRMLVKSPGLTFAGGLGIAVAIAIAGGFFTFSYAHFYPTIPLPEGDRLVGLENWDLSINNENRRSIHDYYIWLEEMQSVEDMSAFTAVDETLIGADGTLEEIEVAHMTPSGFALARVPPFLGRSLVEADMGARAPPVVVIGYDVWRTRFAADPDVLGMDLRLGATPHEVVGVMPEGFAFPMDHDYWVPLKARPADFPLGEGPEIFVSGRLAAGYDLNAAQAELAVIGARMADEFPESHGHLRPQAMAYAYPLMDLNRQGGEGAFRQMAMLNAMVTLLLVVVCLNVAVLVYARAATRRGEIAVRTALGASRLRIVGQMSVEALVLCGLAASVGIVILKVGLTQAELMMTSDLGRPFWWNFGLSGPGMAYVSTLTLLAVVIAGVLPGLQSTGRNVQRSLNKFSSRSGPRLGRTWTALIIGQISVAVAALPLATAMGWWSVRDATTSLTVDVDRFVWFETFRYSPGLRAELGRRIDADPDVVGFEYVYGFPGGGRFRLGFEDRARAGTVAHAVEARTTMVGQRFFETMETQVQAGRTLRPSDWDEGSWYVAVVNRAFADRHLGGRDAIGRRFRLPNEWGAFADDDDVEWYEVVGVVENLHENRIVPRLVDPRAFFPVATDIEAPLDGVIHTAEDPEPLIGRLESHIAQLDPTLRARVVPLGEVEWEEVLALRLVGLALALSILAVMTLSSTGIYAMMSFTVSRRQREIGIRTALGAYPGLVLRGVFRRVLRLIVVGMVVGVGVALGMDRLAGGELLHGLGDVLLTAMVVIMGAAAFLAAIGPARRGLRIAPTEALSGE